MKQVKPHDVFKGPLNYMARESSGDVAMKVIEKLTGKQYNTRQMIERSLI